MSSFIIGIDLGTSTCYAYGMEPGGERKDIPDQSGHLVIDSYIAYSTGLYQNQQEWQQQEWPSSEHL